MGPLSFELANFHLPRWEELPDFGLYMDQVVNLIDKYLNIFVLSDASSDEEKIITSTMINNYVKQKLIKPPVLKKYDRAQMAFFLVVAILKRFLTMNEIAEVMSIVLAVERPIDAYNFFADELELSLKTAFNPTSVESPDLMQINPDKPNYYEALVMRSLALAFANKIYAQKIIQLRGNSQAEQKAKKEGNKEKDKK